MFWVNNNRVTGTRSVSGQRATFSPQTIAGLQVQLFYDVLTTEPALRAYLRLTNPTGAPIAVDVDYASNWGSDGGTIVATTESGDTTITTADRWIITWDGGPFDPVNLTAAWGGSPPVTPVSVSTTVFSCAGTEGYSARYPITIGPGQTRAIVVFQRLATTVAAATAAAAAYTNPNVQTSPLFDGLTPAERSVIANWVAGPVLPDARPVPAGDRLAWGVLALALAALGLLFARKRLL